MAQNPVNLGTVANDGTGDPNRTAFGKINTDIAALYADKLDKAGGTMTGALTLSGDPTNALHAATKQYVDAGIAGLSWKQAVRVATTAAGTLATSFENGDTVDGVTLATGDRILIKDQAAGAENGIYVVAASGAPARASDANSAAELVSASVYVSEGTTNADTQWVCTTNATIVVDTTSLAFAQLTSGGGAAVLYEAEPVTIPAVASFSWVNQGTATATDGNQGIVFTSDADNEIHALVQTAPTAPYDVYMRAKTMVLSSAVNTTAMYGFTSIILRDDVNGDMLEVILGQERVSGDEQNLYYVRLARWTNATTVSSASVFTYYGFEPFNWLRVNVTGVTVTIYASINGVDWVTVSTETIATFVGSITQIGLAGRSNAPATMFFQQFGTTAPSL